MATLAGLALPRWPHPVEAVPSGFLFDENTYQLPDGKIPVLHMGVFSGTSMQWFADVFHTYIDLIYEANGLSEESTIHPGDTLNIPAYAKLPMSYLPEPKIIRHQIKKGDTDVVISKSYGIPVETVSRALTWEGLRHTSDQGGVLLIRGFDSPPVVKSVLLYDEKDSVGHETMRAVVNRVLNRFLYFAGGDTNIFRFLRDKGDIEIVSGAPGFLPPNNVAVAATASMGEGELRRQLGHELWHALPFPSWSAGSDEGTAGFAAVEVATGNGKEYPDKTSQPLYSPTYYNGVNTPDLRNRIFGLAPVENRILATTAWQRIEQKLPGVISHLLITAANSKQADEIEGKTMWPVDLVRGWVIQKFGPVAWKYINSQHILFAK
ncbi:MAG: hypothetical protein UX99_C0003G0003 [Candidatus Amesbacteria bacterium GW2011_GWB1_47_26]|uniref:LysM domain-containing protein n=1 Tax=Candidatus Amesbacteria bacterium GW2011_GWC2_45_19 TaxID=1618366 RepID=A0A0G1M4M3_9BACT|nr:MAG: hypothetical protein UX05_C0003G0003 [Candidatus Amesbacteria bacterium GW2011_GWC2_45_19]KKU38623.1 MAG: hypothetical protein UX52_C0002G0003 [Candidatus Amesbacteria bacterium GW2011_GWA1_46_35]KKU68673.1 MAG: hypothetical protein UX93_C0006G0090 [Microgenomates group bacterium GW2011_GWC1_47_20]KKU74943.1 MAG: hypothetical protein UX99_C0003G0003 [Candidatus Amesbacteria bacterium GW2011_GWB1_47_26]KKU80242.1 MAG: hypothetical protein UY06_C0003G0004 [Candidatus Amesbacteria bacteriu